MNQALPGHKPKFKDPFTLWEEAWDIMLLPPDRSPAKQDDQPAEKKKTVQRLAETAEIAR